MTTSLLIGLQMEARHAIVADAILGPMKFVRADPILDRYGLAVANAIDSSSNWWVWDPENGDAIYGVWSDFDERWRSMLDDLLGLVSERRVIHIAVAHMGDAAPTASFGACNWDGLVDRVRSLFTSARIPADSCVIQYGPDALQC